MRAHPLALTAVFVAAVALAGCEQGPIEPETESTALLKRGGGGGSDGSEASTFHVLFAANSGWDIQTFVDSGPTPTWIPGQAGVGGNSGQVEIGGAGRDHRFRMSADFFPDIFTNWEKCFGTKGQDADYGTAIGGFSGDIKPAKRDGGVTTTFYFNRTDRDDNDMSYVLTLNGTVPAESDFPPANYATTIVTFTDGEITTSGGGKGKKGSSAGSACVGEIHLSLPVSGVSVEATG